MEELEDDVFQPEDGEPGTQSQLDCPLSRLQLFPLTHCCGPGLRPISQEDKATQTLSPASPSQGVMLPCGVTEEPQRLFYGECSWPERLGERGDFPFPNLPITISFLKLRSQGSLFINQQPSSPVLGPPKGQVALFFLFFLEGSLSPCSLLSHPVSSQ